MGAKNRTVLIILSLFCTYFFWGSTYLAIKFGIESFPPFLMAALRFLTAGTLLYALMRYLGRPNPTRSEWVGATIIGILLPAVGNGTVTFVQQTVSSSVAALSIATAPIWMAIFSALWGHHITRREWLGIAIGFMGLTLLNFGGTLQGDTVSACLLIAAAASWSFGSVWSKHLRLPQGLMGAACQMVAGGVALLLTSLLMGESWPTTVSAKSWGAMAFLIVLGSIITYSAYQYLLSTVRPMVASSNTFVNPIVAFVLGIWLANEQVSIYEYLALAVILAGVFLVLTTENKALS